MVIFSLFFKFCKWAQIISLLVFKFFKVGLLFFKGLVLLGTTNSKDLLWNVKLSGPSILDLNN